MKYSTDKNKRKIEKRIWLMLIEISKIRSNGRCEFPGCSSVGEQRDHCFSASKCPKIRFDWRNITNLCGFHHSKKTYCSEGAEKIVDEVVKNREGIHFWNELKELAKQDMSFKWNCVNLEEQEIAVKEALEYFRKRTE